MNLHSAPFRCLAVLMAANPRRINRRSPMLRGTSLLLAALVSLANCWSALQLVLGLVHGTEGEDAGPLLMTGAGMLVANPVFAPAALQAEFGPGAYHGTVIWSWQQALAAAGLARQLARSGLAAGVRHRLAVAQSCLWNVIDATRAYQSSELWSWRYADGRYQVVAFGAGAKDADESNAAQLWSTVFLALHRPPSSAADRCPAG